MPRNYYFFLHIVDPWNVVIFVRSGSLHTCKKLFLQLSYCMLIFECTNISLLVSLHVFFLPACPIYLSFMSKRDVSRIGWYWARFLESHWGHEWIMRNYLRILPWRSETSSWPVFTEMWSDLVSNRNDLKVEVMKVIWGDSCIISFIAIIES